MFISIPKMFTWVTIQFKLLRVLIASCFFSFAGLIYAITALGVAAGYMGGGLFLNLWVDIDKADVDLDKYAYSNEVIGLGTWPNLNFFLIKDALCQVWMKLTQWLWRIRFFNISMNFCNIAFFRWKERSITYSMWQSLHIEHSFIESHRNSLLWTRLGWERGGLGSWSLP